MDYKEKYEKALEKATVAYKDEDRHLKATLERIFPELAGSEDESIRKGLIAIITDFDNLYLQENYFLSREETLAWLEKQGEHANFRNKIQVGDKVTRNEDGVLVNLSQMKRVAKKDEKKGEQKSADKVEPKFKVGQTIKKEGFNIGFTIAKIENGFYYDATGSNFPINDEKNWELVEQKPVEEIRGNNGGISSNSEWSEEDISMIGGIRSIIEKYAFSQSAVDVNGELCEQEYIDADNWLKSLKCKVQPQPKQEWSDVDKDILFRTIDNLKFLKDTISTDPKYAVNIIDIEREITWLKSLKDRVLQQSKQEWSEEDEEILKELTKFIPYHLTAYSYNRYYNWAISHRPQKHWKPSDEQMKALNYVVNIMASSERPTENDLYYNILKSLREQLRKLTE